MTKHLRRLNIVARSISKMVVQNGTFGWVFVSIIIALAIAINSWHFIADISTASLNVEARLTDLRHLSDVQPMTNRTATINNIHRNVSMTENDFQPVRRIIIWAWRFSPAFPWLPVARQEMNTWASQGHRIQQNLQATSKLMDSSSQLFELQNDVETSLLDSNIGTSIPILKAQALHLEETFKHNFQTIQASKLAGSASNIGLQTPQMRNLIIFLDELEDKILTASKIGWESSDLMNNLLDIVVDAQPLMNQLLLDEPQSGNWTIQEFKEALASMEEGIISSMLKLKQVNELAFGTDYDDQLIPHLNNLNGMLAVLLAISQATMTCIQTIEPTINSMENSTAGLLSGNSGLVRIFEAFNLRSNEIEHAMDELERAQAILRDLESQNQNAPFINEMSKISSLVNDIYTGFNLTQKMAPIGKSLLGNDGTRTYLVLGQSADELRATGGFVSSIWLLRFENGNLENVEYQDSVRVDDWDRLGLYPKAPLGLDEHMNAWVWLMRDVSWDPDFPTTARTAMDMFYIGKRQDVDGVIAINQWTLLRLIEAIGNIKSPNEESHITSRNLLTMLEQGTDQHGRVYMDLILQQILEELNQSVSIPTLIRLASALHDTLEERDMLLYFDNPVLQSFPKEFGWAGSIRQDSTDYLYVVDSNVGWSKVDRNIERDISYAVDLTKTSAPRSSLTLRYDNHSGPNSPQCEPQWRFRGIDYSQLKNACYWNFLRVFIPQDSNILNATYLSLPEQSVSVEIGRGVTGQDTGRISASHNKLLFSGLANLEAGTSNEVNLIYDLPASVVRHEGDTTEYKLFIQKQPGVRQKSFSLEIKIQDGYHLESSSLTPTNQIDSRLDFTLTLTQDVMLSFKFKKDTNDSH